MNRAAFAFAAILLWAAPSLAQEVTGLAGWNIYLDPGHGGSNQNVGAFGYSEADKVLGIGLRLRDLLLSETDIDTVYLSRTRDEDVSLSQRVDHANGVGATHFHSIHSNAGDPGANHVFVLWPQYRDGSEAVPHGGKRAAELMSALLGRSMRIESRGGIGECDLYGVSECRDRDLPEGKGGSRNYVQSFTNMPSELSEAGFHTNPTQNQRNMNADWKALEARALYWAILAYHGLPRPATRIVTGIVSDLETGKPINGARVTLGGKTYTTDAYASLFNHYSDDPDELANGFYYVENVPSGGLTLQVEADDYALFVGEITPVDSFFTFADVQLISTLAPTVVSSAPEPGQPRFRITDNIAIDFSRPMDRETVEAAFSIAPAAEGVFRWMRGDRTLVFDPAADLLPTTDYTLTLDAGAASFYGKLPLDGNGDGTGGDAFTLPFRTGFADADPPRLVASTPWPNAIGVELRPIVTAVYDEPIDPATLEGRMFLETLLDQTPVAGTARHYSVGAQSVVSFFPDASLSPRTAYRLRFAEGVSDPYGNEAPASAQVRFETGETALSVRLIDDFESGVDEDWWVPQQSGTTTGIVTDSTGASPDTTITNLLSGSRASFRLDYGWDVNAGEWLIREYLNGGPPQEVTFDTTYTLQAYIFGDGSGNLFRFAVDEQLPATSADLHEVSPWIALDWLGWRLVSWRPSRDGTGTWLGNGIPEGTLRFDSIQLSHTPGAAAFGRLYVDDLRLAEPAAATAREALEVPTRVRLHPNYPNPFNPSTTIRFELPSPAAVTLRVYNALGAEVATLVSEKPFAAGTHEVRWDAGDLPSGVYVCRLETGLRSQSIRLVLLR